MTYIGSKFPTPPPPSPTRVRGPEGRLTLADEVANTTVWVTFSTCAATPFRIVAQWAVTGSVASAAMYALAHGTVMGTMNDVGTKGILRLFPGLDAGPSTRTGAYVLAHMGVAAAIGILASALPHDLHVLETFHNALHGDFHHLGHFDPKLGLAMAAVDLGGDAVFRWLFEAGRGAGWWGRAGSVHESPPDAGEKEAKG